MPDIPSTDARVVLSDPPNLVVEKPTVLRWFSCLDFALIQKDQEIPDDVEIQNSTHALLHSSLTQNPYRLSEAQVEDLDSRIEAIQWLIPLGLKAVTEELQRAVVELAGPRYERKGPDQPLRRWGSQPGSVYLGDQKLPVEVPRVRNVASDTEVPLNAYQALQTPRQMDEGLLLRMLKGIHRHAQLRGLR